MKQNPLGEHLDAPRMVRFLRRWAPAAAAFALAACSNAQPDGRARDDVPPVGDRPVLAGNSDVPGIPGPPPPGRGDGPGLRMPLHPGESAANGNLPMDVMYFALLRLEGTDMQLTPEQAEVIIGLLELRNRYMFIVSHEARLVDKVLTGQQKTFLDGQPRTADVETMIDALWKQNVGRVRDALRRTAGVDSLPPIPLPDTMDADFDKVFGPPRLAHFLLHFFDLEADPAMRLSREQARALLPSFERHWLILPLERPNVTAAKTLRDDQKGAVDRVVAAWRDRPVHLLEDARTLYRKLVERTRGTRATPG